MKQASGNIQLIQKMNRLKVMNYVRKHPDTSRPLIAQATGLSAGTLTNITSYLINAGLLKEKGYEKVERVGRKGALLQFCSDSYGIICVVLNLKSVSIFYTDLDGKPLKRISENTENLTQQQIIEITLENVRKMIDIYGMKKTLGISIAINGMILDNNRFVLSASLKWTDLDLKSILEDETGLTVFLDNRSMLKASCFFHSRKSVSDDNILYIDLDDGIGASHCYKGEINRAFLGEIGHTTIEPDGERCFCGNYGCLEVMCSPKRIIRLYKEYSGIDAELSYINKKYIEHEAAAVRAINDCARYLGIGVSNLMNLCKASDIVFDLGDFSQAHSIIDAVKPELKKRIYPVLLSDLNIHEVITSEENIIKGAAFNFCDRFFDVSFEGCTMIIASDN